MANLSAQRSRSQQLALRKIVADRHFLPRDIWLVAISLCSRVRRIGHNSGFMAAPEREAADIFGRAAPDAQGCHQAPAYRVSSYVPNGAHNGIAPVTTFSCRTRSGLDLESSASIGMTEVGWLAVTSQCGFQRWQCAISAAYDWRPSRASNRMGIVSRRIA